MLFIKREIQKFLLKYGYNVSKSRIIELPTEIHPLEIQYHYNSQDVFLYNIPIDKCRGLTWFDLNNHPFVEMLKLRESNSINEMEEYLSNFYESFLSPNVSEYLMVDIREFENVESIAATRLFPWSSYDVNKALTIRRRTTDRENHENGIKDKGRHGHQFCGPISNEKLKSEVGRNLKTVKSIEEKGYHRNNKEDGDITSFILVNNILEEVFLINGGQHRIVALKHLNYEEIPVRIRIQDIIRVTDVDLWPGVKKGIYTRDQAIQVFNNVFYAQPPSSCKWKK